MPSPAPASALLERERELAQLHAAVAEAHAGSGQLVVIEAQAGLGKTRLLQAARAAGTAAGLHVLAARATELERDFPFALVRQLFEPQLSVLTAPERDALLDGASSSARGALGLADAAVEPPAPIASDTFAVLHGLYWLTAALADRHPLLLAVDDAHWSDAASLDYLSFLLPRLEELPLLLVVACRPDEADAERTLARIATDTVAQRLTPSPLSRDAAATLLATELGSRPEQTFAATCHEVSGGNPFLLCELARTLAAQGVEPGAEEAEAIRDLAPERVTRTVLLRVARLPATARAVARALAVLGDDSDPHLVAALAGLSADATTSGADALRCAAILDPEPPLRFIHPLVRNALHADVPAGERAAAHLRAATLLRERGADCERLAAHLVASEPSAERATVETLLDAGGRALANGAPRSAIAYLTRALREPPPADLRAAVLTPLLTATIRVLDRSAFQAIEGDVFTELERDPTLLSRWATDITPWMMIDERVDAATALLERAIDVAAGEDDIDRAIHLEGQLIAFAALPPASAKPRLARYRHRVEPGSAGERLLAAFDASWGLFDGEATAAAELARRALHESRIFAEQAELLVPGEALRVLTLADDFDAARHIMDEALDIARRRGGLWDMMGAWYLRAHVALARGDLAAAAADVNQARAVAHLRSVLGTAPTFVALSVAILIERGEPQTAEAELTANGTATGPIVDLPFFDALLLARGHLHLARGRAREAAEDFIELHDRRTRRGTSSSPIMQTGSCAARALAAVGEHARARELAEADLLHARRWGAPTAVARALRALAVTTDGPAAIAALEEAAALLDHSPAQLERAHALADLGAALRRANHRAGAREPLRKALELARRCGAASLAKRAHDELLATGEKVRRYTPIGVESLTPSERRVAELAASDMTNRQIAQSLFLTVKTIETHLGAAYDKLGIRSRQQLAGALRERSDASVSVD